MFRATTTFCLRLLLFYFVIASASAQNMLPETFNYTYFSQPRFAHKDEALRYNADQVNHPELGQLFTEAPCEDCYEVLSKRTETGKYFLKSGSNGEYIYQQSSTDPMHIRDAQGNWKTIITSLRPDYQHPFLYTADRQPIPVGIDASNGFTYLGGTDQRFYFHRQLELIFRDAAGIEQVVGSADWTNHTAGDDGVYVTDIWPGIDLELRVARGQIKSNYVIKNPLPAYTNGKLIIRDHWKTDGDLHVDKKTEGQFHDGIELKNQSGDVISVISPVISYDRNSRSTGDIGSLNYEINGNNVDIIIPHEWYNRSASAYPITIDPLVQGTNSMAITGSGYNATCFAGGCAYNLAVPVPAAITVTDIRWSFNYMTNGALCWLSDGAVDFTLGACRSPNAAGFYWFCNGIGGGTCTGANISMYSHLQPCVPAPQCASYNMNFTMRFYRCYGSGGGCTNTCIAAASPLTIVVEGRTLEIAGGTTTLPAANICQGQSTTLTPPTGSFGVPAYSYTWNPGGLTGSPSVSPAATTIYTCVVTDACGNTVTATKTVNVTAVTNPGFTIAPNPVCQGQNITVTGLGSGAATAYNWTVPGSANPTVTNSQTFTTNYPTSGTYNVTLTYSSGTCSSTSSQSVTVTPNLVPTANITVSPTGTICPGQSVTFTATGTNLGTTPTYQWQVNGVNAGTNSPTFTSNTLTNGNTVTVIITSNAGCVSPATATSNSIVMNVAASLVPAVTITATPNGPICAGTNVTFTATPTNGGSTPQYQWQVNGVNAGTNSPTFSTSTLANGNTVTCILTSNDPCANPTTATSNTITMTVNPPLVPSVNITSAPPGPICAGTNVTFTATPTNGGTSPQYQWQVNGVNAGTNSNTFSTSTLTSGQVVTVILTSNATCVSPATATSNSISYVVNPIIAPSVTIAANPGNTICSGTNVTFTATPTNGGTTPQYQWQINGVNTGTNSNTFTNSGLQNGDIVTVILTSNATCVNPATATSNAINMVVTQTVVPTATISVSPSGPICAGTNVTFTAVITNGGTAPAYQWKINGVNTGTNSATFSSSTLNNGDIVSLTLSSNAPCANPASVNSNTIAMTVNPMVTPTVSITANPNGNICPGQNVTFTPVITNGGANPQYDWFVNGVQTSNVTNYSNSGLQNGDVVSVTLTSDANCVTTPTANSNTITINWWPPVGINLSADQTICDGEKAVLTATPVSGFPPTYQVSWQPGGANTNSITVFPGSTTTYTATVSDLCGSTAAGTVTVTVQPKPVAAFTYNPVQPDLTNQPTTFIDGSTGAVAWHWNFGSNQTSNSQNPVFEFTAGGVYPIILEVTSAENCKDTAFAQITIEELFTFYIPSAFTPNEDPFNQEWKPQGTGIRHYRLEIYNRWGQKIFESVKVENGWNGTLSNGEAAPLGVYDYRIDLEFENTDQRVFIGKITLIR